MKNNDNNMNDHSRFATLKSPEVVNFTFNYYLFISKVCELNSTNHDQLVLTHFKNYSH